MHDADNEVTQADRDAYEALMHDEHCDDLDTGWEHFARHRIASIEAACRDRDAEIEQARDDAATFCIQSLASMLGNPDYAQADGSEEWEGDVSGTLYNVLAAAGVLSEDDHSFVTLTERDQLRAKLDGIDEVLAADVLQQSYELGISGRTGESPGQWMLRVKRGAVRAFLASAPQPLVSKEQAIKLAEMEGDAEIGAGMPDHPLRQPEAVCSACDGESKGCTGEFRCLRCNGSGIEATPPAIEEGCASCHKSDCGGECLG